MDCIQSHSRLSPKIDKDSSLILSSSHFIFLSNRTPRMSTHNASRLVLLFAIISLSILLFHCRKTSITKPEPVPQPTIYISVLSPSTGPPGTIVKILGSSVAASSQDAYVKFAGLNVPIMSSGGKNIVFAVPSLSPGNYSVNLHKIAGDSSNVLTFSVTTLPGTGLPPGQITSDIITGMDTIVVLSNLVISHLQTNDFITATDANLLYNDFGKLKQLLSGALNQLNSLPDSEKVIIDGILKSSGLSDAVGSSKAMIKSGMTNLGLLGQLAGYNDFYNLILWDNLSFCLSSINASLTIVGVAAIIASGGLSFAGNAALATIQTAITALDAYIDSRIPTDLYHIEVSFIPDNGSTLEVGETAKGLFLGSFQGQSNITDASIDIILTGAFSIAGPLIDLSKIKDLANEVAQKVGLNATQELFESPKITLQKPVPVDISFYAKTSQEILSYTSTVLSGMFPGPNIANIFIAVGVPFPVMNVTPVTISSPLVKYDFQTNTLTALQPGTVLSQYIFLNSWTINLACEADGSWWWDWVCLGIELPEFLLSAAYTKSQIVVNSLPVNHPPYTPTNPKPLDGQSDVPIDSKLFWSGGDPDLNDTVYYDIGVGILDEYFTPIDSFSSIGQIDTMFDPGLLPYYATILWSAVARDNHGAQSDSARWMFRTEKEPTANYPPNTPPSPLGPFSGYVNISYEFSTSTTDPDGDNIACRFDWGDGNISGWSNFMPSGSTYKLSHSYGLANNYCIKSQAKDVSGNFSNWSDCHQISISNEPSNTPPNKPVIYSAPDTGTVNVTYWFGTHGTDPDGDSVSFRFDFGDGDSSAWSNFVTSGNGVSFSHIYLIAGTYFAKSQSRDNEGSFSVWSDPHLVVINGPSHGVIMDSIPLSEGLIPNDMAWDGNGLWLTFLFGDSIQKISISDGTILRTLHFDPELFCPGGCNLGIAWDGSSLWVHYVNSIHKVNPSNGGSLGSFIFWQEGIVHGTSWDNGYLWIVGGTMKIYKVDAARALADGNADSAVVTQFAWPGQSPHGLEYYNNRLYALDWTNETYATLYELDTSGNTVSSFTIQKAQPFPHNPISLGLATDGVILFVGGENYKILKVSF